MQILKFEPSWEKAISINDRKLITGIFQSSNTQFNQTTRLKPIWEATNYKGEVLITVLIHNFTNTTLIFRNQKLSYQEKNIVIAEHIFTVPQLVIKPKTSMPWTFIFPIESLYIREIHGNGKLEILKNE